MPYSRLNDVEEKLESITYKGHTYVGGGGSSIYVIKTNDSTAPSDSNVFSAKRSLATLLRKDKEDRTEFLMKLLGGIISPFLTSPDFVTGMMGAGMSFSSEEGGESVGWIDKLYVRKKAIFQLLSIMETELAGASFMFNSSGARATITKVERIDASRSIMRMVVRNTIQMAAEHTYSQAHMALCTAVTSLQTMVRKQSRTVSVWVTWYALRHLISNLEYMKM